MNEQQLTYAVNQNVDKTNLSNRIEAIGWSALLIMTGGILLAPGNIVTLYHVWLIGVGMIQLGANLARYLTGLKLRGFNTVLGITAVAAGLAGFLGIDLPLLAIFLILIGAQIMLHELIGKRAGQERMQ